MVKINYKRLYEQELLKNEQLEARYRTTLSEKQQAERRSLDIINKYEGILLELETLKNEYSESLESLIEKGRECEYMRRSLITIMQEIRRSNPRKIGVDIDIH